MLMLAWPTIIVVMVVVYVLVKALARHDGRSFPFLGVLGALVAIGFVSLILLKHTGVNHSIAQFQQQQAQQMAQKQQTRAQEMVRAADERLQSLARRRKPGSPWRRRRPRRRRARRRRQSSRYRELLKRWRSRCKTP